MKGSSQKLREFLQKSLLTLIVDQHNLRSALFLVYFPKCDDPGINIKNFSGTVNVWDSELLWESNGSQLGYTCIVGDSLGDTNSLTPDDLECRFSI